MSGSGWQKVFRFDYGDYAELTGMSRDAVRRAVRARKFDPADLRSVVAFWVRSQMQTPGLQGGRAYLLGALGQEDE